jgi:hypothetical protein
MHIKAKFCLLLAISILPVISTGTVAQSQSLIGPPERSTDNVKFGDLPISVQASVSTETFVVSYVTFEPTKLRMGLVQPKEPSEGGASLERLMRDSNAIAIMNGGFLDSTSPATPAGYLRISNQIINSAAEDKVADGLVCFAPDIGAQAVVITKYANLERTAANYPDCVQGGPLLALDGRPLPNLEPLDEDPALKKFAIVAAARSFLAKTKGGAIVMGVTTPVSLYSLRTALLQTRSMGGFEASDAIALTGRSTAGLLVGTAFQRGRSNTLLPDAIIVRQ